MPNSFYKDALPLPDELHEVWGHLRFLESHGSGSTLEWSSECPECGSSGHKGSSFPDRFRMFTNPARGWCRRCNYFALASAPKTKMSDAQRVALEREFEAMREERARLRLERLEAFTKEELWLAYHRKLREDKGHRDALGKRGIPNDWQDFWKFGLDPDHPYGPAITIPYFDVHWQPRTIQYRLDNPPSESDRYRFHPGLGAPYWIARPEKGIAGDGEVFVVEGAFKGGVTHIYGLEGETQCIAQPSKSYYGDLGVRLHESGVSRVWIVCDPDAFDKPANARNAWIPTPVRLAREIGDAARLVTSLKAKVDDWLLAGNRGKLRAELPYAWAV